MITESGMSFRKIMKLLQGDQSINLYAVDVYCASGTTRMRPVCMNITHQQRHKEHLEKVTDLQQAHQYPSLLQKFLPQHRFQNTNAIRQMET
jgi:hypothetical protein